MGRHLYQVTPEAASSWSFLGPTVQVACWKSYPISHRVLHHQARGDLQAGGRRGAEPWPMSQAGVPQASQSLPGEKNPYPPPLPSGECKGVFCSFNLYFLSTDDFEYSLS